MEICTVHDVAEALPDEDVYLRCERCRHSYITGRELRSAYRRHVIWWLFRVDHATPNPWPFKRRRHTLRRSLISMCTVRADEILICPHCTAGL